MVDETIDAIASKEFEKFAEGTFLSVGFLNKNSIQPLAELFNEYFEKRNKTEEKTVTKLSQNIDTSLKQNFEQNRKFEQQLKSKEAKEQSRTERLLQEYERQRKDTQQATKTSNKKMDKVVATIARTYTVLEKALKSSFVAQQEITQTLQRLDTSGLLLKGGFNDVNNVVQQTGWAFEDVASLLSQSAPILSRFVSQTTNGTDVMTQMYSQIPTKLNIASNEFVSMFNNFMKFRKESDIQSAEFQNEWKIYYQNMKLFSRVTGKSIENLEQMNNLQATDNAVKVAQMKNPQLVNWLKMAGLQENTIAALSTGGLVNSKEYALMQQNELGRFLVQNFTPKNLTTMNIEDVKKLLPEWAKAAELTQQRQKNMSTSEMAVASKSQDFAYMYGLGLVDIDTLITMATNYKKISEHQATMDNETKTTEAFGAAGELQKSTNRVNSEWLTWMAGSTDLAIKEYQALTVANNATLLALRGTSKAFDKMTDKLANIIAELSGLNKDKVQSWLSAGKGLIMAAFTVFVPTIAMGVASWFAKKSIGGNLFGNRPKNTPKISGPKNTPKAPAPNPKAPAPKAPAPKAPAPKAPAPNPKAPAPKAPPLKTLPKKPFLTGAAKGTGVLSAAMVLAELNAVGAEEYINRRRRPMEGLDYLDPLQYIQRGLLKIKFDKGVEWAVNKVADQFNDTEEIRTQKSKEWLIKNGYLDSSGMYLRLSNSKNTEEVLKAHADKLSVPQKDVEEYYTKKIIQEDKDKRSKYIENRQVEYENTLRQILIELQKITENTGGTNKNMEKIAENDKKNSLNPIYNQR